MKNTIRYAACAMIAIAGGNWLLAEPPENKKPDSERKSKTANVPSVDSTSRTEPASPFPTIPTPSKMVYPNANAYGTNPPAAFNATYPNATGSPQHSQGANSITPSTPPVFGGYSMGTIGPALPGISLSQTYGAPFVVSGTHQTFSPEETERNKAFLEAVNQLRSQKTEEDKSSAREKLSKLVSEQLDADLKKREDELAAIEKRTQQLRAQLEERKAAKPEMLKMLVLLIDNPQMGLGIPAEWMQMLMSGYASGIEHSPTLVHPSR